jgi:polyhydroxyalkanoate synthesis regulator protein
MQKNPTGTSRDQTRAMDQPEQPTLVKRYAGQRLYRPATSTYLTHGDLIAMAKSGKKFVVIDARTHDDVTSLYQPIMVER